MARYLALVKALTSHIPNLGTFKSFLETHIPNNENHIVDVLANFTSSAPTIAMSTSASWNTLSYPTPELVLSNLMTSKAGWYPSPPT